MSQVHERFQAQQLAVHRYTVPGTLSLIAVLLLGAILVAAALMAFTPWIQTAYGEGEINTRNPEQRIQAISALVPGQISRWHVREGDRIKAGDPIVTLIDTDPELIERLDSQIRAATAQRDARLAALETEQKNLQRQRGLQKEGLTSERDVEKMIIRIEEVRADIASIEADLSKLKVTRSRQSLQTKTAPSDGSILRLQSAGNSTYVKSGDVLAQFIPDSVERAVVLNINGMDASLVVPGRRVRLQFEGWPVFQVSGWPDAGIGTFGGIVEFIEPVALADGRSRVWIKPDPADQAWPAAEAVRLGSRVRGWILLEEVPLGYEFWRQLNNFPPVNKVSQSR